VNLKQTAGTGIVLATLTAGALTAFGLTQFHAPINSPTSLSATMTASTMVAMSSAAGELEAQEQAKEAHAFKVDPVHSTAIFCIEHLGVSRFYGRFNTMEGTFTIDRDDPSASSINITIEAESVDTNNSGRDRHLKGPDFFDARQFPKISFVSTGIEKASEDTWNVTGDLTLHGVTKTITVPVEITGVRDTGRQGVKGGIATEFRIKRSDFGMTTYVAEGGLGDEVALMIGVEGAKQ